MEQEKLATELLHEIKNQSRRWFIAFLVVTILWFATIGGFVWYITLPIEDEVTTTETTVTNDDGNANYVDGSVGGDINNGNGN